MRYEPICVPGAICVDIFAAHFNWNSGILANRLLPHLMLFVTVCANKSAFFSNSKEHYRQNPIENLNCRSSSHRIRA